MTYEAPRIIPLKAGAVVRYVECSGCGYKDTVRGQYEDGWAGVECPKCHVRMHVTDTKRK